MLLYKGRHLMILAYQPAALLTVSLHRYACLITRTCSSPALCVYFVLGVLESRWSDLQQGHFSFCIGPAKSTPWDSYHPILMTKGWLGK